MPIYLYIKKSKANREKELENRDYWISPIKINNPKYKRLIQYDKYEICNIPYTNIPKGLNYHILNNSAIIPTRLATKVIINKKTLSIRLCEKYDVLRDYKITIDELVFVVYFINNGIKVFYGNFHLGRYYTICTGCSNLISSQINICKICGIVICKRCCILDEKYCDECYKELDSSDLENNVDSEEYNLLDKLEDSLMDSDRIFLV
jgi:hypothetical protein